MSSVVSVKKAVLVKRGIKCFLEWKHKPNSVYIGRNMDFYVTGATESKWKNPFTVKKHGLDKCLVLFEQYLRDTPSLYNALEELEGKELGCWCKPGACHGDILIKVLNEKKLHKTT